MPVQRERPGPSCSGRDNGDRGDRPRGRNVEPAWGGRSSCCPMADGRPSSGVAVEQVLAAGLDDTVVVLGRDAEAVARALAGLPVRTVVNPRYAEGQSTSLRAGLDALRPGTDGGRGRARATSRSRTRQVIRWLVDVFRTSGRPIAVPVYRDGRGNPVLFAATLFDELRAVDGRSGRPGRDRPATPSGSPRCPSTRRCRPTSTRPRTTRRRGGGPESPAVGSRDPLIQWVAGAAPRTPRRPEEPACATRSGRSRP